MRTLDEPFVPGDEERRIAVVQMTMPPTGEEFVAAARSHVERQRVDGRERGGVSGDAVTLPAAYAHDAVCDAMVALAAETGIWVSFVVWAPDGDGYRTMYLVGPNGIAGAAPQTHKPPGEKFAGDAAGRRACRRS